MVQVVLFFLGGEHVYIYIYMSVCVQLHASIAGKQATYIYIYKFTSQLHASIAGEQDIYIYIHTYIYIFKYGCTNIYIYVVKQTDV